MSTLTRDYERFAKEAKEICKDRVYTDHLRRYAYGVDASCYSYLPKVVVKAEDERKYDALFVCVNNAAHHFTFRVRLVLLCLVNVPVKTCLSYVMMASKNGSYRRWQGFKLRMWCYRFRCERFVETI